MDDPPLRLAQFAEIDKAWNVFLGERCRCKRCVAYENQELFLSAHRNVESVVEAQEAVHPRSLFFIDIDSYLTMRSDQRKKHNVKLHALETVHGSNTQL